MLNPKPLVLEYQVSLNIMDINIVKYIFGKGGYVGELKEKNEEYSG